MQTILLPNPVEVDGVIISSISLRPPTPEDYRVVQRPPAGRCTITRRLIARLAGVPPQTISAILRSSDQAAECVEAAVLSFLS